MTDTNLAEAPTADAAEPSMPPMPQATEEHRWLHRLIGRWTASTDQPCPTGEPVPEWTETVRGIGDIWVLGEGVGEGPDGTPMITVIQLGYDPEKGRYIGTWMGSMMQHMWHYSGSIDESGDQLILDCEGPDFGKPGHTARYQDIVAFFGDDHRALISRMQGEDGQWNQIMRVDYHRAA